MGEVSNAKKIDCKKRWKGRKKKRNDRGGVKKALLGRCQVCSHVVETMEMKERTRISESVAPKSLTSDIPGATKSNKKSAIENSSKKKKKKRKTEKEEFAGLKLSKKSHSPSTASQPLKAGDKRLLEMLRKNPASSANGGDRLSAFLRK